MSTEVLTSQLLAAPPVREGTGILALRWRLLQLNHDVDSSALLVYTTETAKDRRFCNQDSLAGEHLYLETLPDFMNSD